MTTEQKLKADKLRHEQQTALRRKIEEKRKQQYANLRRKWEDRGVIAL
jgi:hypothetical protein